MTSSPSHPPPNGSHFASHNHVNLASASVFPSQLTGQTLRPAVMGLELLGVPEGVQPGSSANTLQSGKLKGHPHGKKTKGRVKIKMEFIDNKLRRYTTFSKRKAGLMKKASELATLTGTEVMLLVASETGHVYTYATGKLQPMIASEEGKKLIQTCLNSNLPNGSESESLEHRLNLATGYDEEADEDDDEYFDEDGDSSNGSPPPGEARFHNLTSASSHQTDSQSLYPHGDYGAALGDSYGLSAYSSAGLYDSSVRQVGEGGIQDGYEVGVHEATFSVPADSARR